MKRFIVGALLVAFCAVLFTPVAIVSANHLSSVDLSQEVGSHEWRVWHAEMIRLASVDLNAEMGSLALRGWQQEQTRILAIDLNEEVGGYLWRNWFSGR